jgi:hypothetical protein
MAADLGPALFALHHPCAVVLATSRQLEDGRSRVTFIPDPVPQPRSQYRPEELCERWLNVFYEELLACPEQWWLWSFVNFKPLNDPGLQRKSSHNRNAR